LELRRDGGPRKREDEPLAGELGRGQGRRRRGLAARRRGAGAAGRSRQREEEGGRAAPPRDAHAPAARAAPRAPRSRRIMKKPSAISSGVASSKAPVMSTIATTTGCSPRPE